MLSTVEEINAYREQAALNKNPLPFQSPWRDADPKSFPDAPFVIRLNLQESVGYPSKTKFKRR